MLAEGFADAHPVVTVLVVGVVFVLVLAVVVFLRPIERFLNRTHGKKPPPTAGLLWVDDRPEHNARLLNGLREQGVPVDVVQTTSEAVVRLNECAYAIVVSDVSRVEEVSDTDLRLLEQVGVTTPVVIFSRYESTSAAYRALSDGTVVVVSTEAEIRDRLRAVDLLR
jgi:ActR/RegA family two-component response regulator